MQKNVLIIITLVSSHQLNIPAEPGSETESALNLQNLFPIFFIYEQSFIPPQLNRELVLIVNTSALLYIYISVM